MVLFGVLKVLIYLVWLKDPNSFKMTHLQKQNNPWSDSLLIMSYNFFLLHWFGIVLRKVSLLLWYPRNKYFSVMSPNQLNWTKRPWSPSGRFTKEKLEFTLFSDYDSPHFINQSYPPNPHLTNCKLSVCSYLIVPGLTFLCCYHK